MQNLGTLPQPSLGDLADDGRREEERGGERRREEERRGERRRSISSKDILSQYSSLGGTIFRGKLYV